MGRMTKRAVVVALALLVATVLEAGVASGSPRPDEGGTPLLCPSGSVNPGDLDPVPNDQAILRRICAPGHDAGFVPQGLTFYEGAPFNGARIIISGYYAGSHTCALYAVHPTTGRSSGPYRLPNRRPRGYANWGNTGEWAKCGHAGGIAVHTGSLAYVADTPALFEVDLARAFASSSTQRSRALRRRIPLEGDTGSDFFGSLIGFDEHDGPDGRCPYTFGCVWVGTYHKSDPNIVRRLNNGHLDSYPNLAVYYASWSYDDRDAPKKAQGFDIAGNDDVWVSSSLASANGCLHRIAPWGTSTVASSFQFIPGSEGLEFAADGRLWTVSEAGAGTYQTKYYPLIVEVATELLTETPGCSPNG